MQGYQMIDHVEQRYMSIDTLQFLDQICQQFETIFIPRHSAIPKNLSAFSTMPPNFNLTRTRSILIIGAGELGLAIINALLSHSSYSPTTTTLTLLIRPSSLNSPSPEKAAQNTRLRSLGVAFTPGDIESLTSPDLTTLLEQGAYTAVLHAGGMNLTAGTMLKLTRAVIDAKVPYYVPWQHGVDYDVIGREGGQGMFSEQIDVRDALRGQSTTDWVILSCGIFMSFLFEEFWGVVSKLPAKGQEGKERVRVTALNSWDDMVTATTAEDIGMRTAELLFDADAPINQPVFIAGETLSYGDLANTIARIVEPRGTEVVRQAWPLEGLKEESRKDSSDKLKKFRVVFAEGKGLSWAKLGTWNAQEGIDMVGVEEWARERWV